MQAYHSLVILDLPSRWNVNKYNLKADKIIEIFFFPYSSFHSLCSHGIKYSYTNEHAIKKKKSPIDWVDGTLRHDSQDSQKKKAEIC